MLAPLCQALPPSELIIAARFISNEMHVSSFNDEIMMVPLDYTCDQSATLFLHNLSKWDHLQFIILWVHSSNHGFSRRIIETVSTFDIPPTVIHVFGSKEKDSNLIQCAKAHNVRLTPVKLGKIETPAGWRWLTHQEISTQVADALRDAGTNAPI
ncbi:MAG: hypothetical protein V6Z81_07560 [Parvularculales bacterium]